MTTPLEEHRARNLDPAEVARIEALIAEHGVKYIYYQFVSINGRVLAKVVPAGHLRRNLEKGVQFHGTAIADLTSDRNGNLMGGGAQAEEFTILPDTDTFAVLPWDNEIGRFFCRVYRRADRMTDPGTPHPLDCRGILRRTHEAFTAATGLELRSGTEPEMSWIGEGVDVVSRPGVSPAYHGLTLDMMRPVFKRVISYAQALGLDMVEGDYEDNGQLELNWMFDRADATADRLVTYRQICRQVAKELGVVASFMPKPFTGVMGNGCHHNVSLWRGDENVFMDKGIRELHVTETAKHALGGMLQHAAGSMMVMASTVNSYKRYSDVGLFAPTGVDWGLDNKSCSVRVSAIGRLEYKIPDASVNPYLSHTLLLAAMERGLREQIDPGAPQQLSSYESKAESPFESLPTTLGDAIRAFAADDLVTGALGRELSDLLIEYKTDEWLRYCGVVSDWEREMYLEFMP